MLKIPLLPVDIDCRARYLDGRLPGRYMEDFSLPGLVVDRYDAARGLLIEKGYQLSLRDDGAEIALSTIRQLPDIVSTLTSADIYCEFSDIADTIYQA